MQHSVLMITIYVVYSSHVTMDVHVINKKRLYFTRDLRLFLIMILDKYKLNKQCCKRYNRKRKMMCLNGITCDISRLRQSL